jgi:phosphohistidine phosphatase
MIRKLILIRHGDAESRRLGETDAQRRLTARGVEALKRDYPALLAPLKDDLDDIHVWSSEAVRAEQTAQVVCDVLGIPYDDIEFHQSLYAQDYDFFCGELEAADGVVVAVGHIPFMEEVASDLAKRMMSLTKGSIVCFDLSEGKLAKAKLLFAARGPKVW